MRSYLLLLVLLVGICHKARAESSLPLVPEPMPNCPFVFLPPNIHYAHTLIHRYNAHVSNPNLVVPSCERLHQDGQRGLQGWLPCAPNLSAFPAYLAYPIYRERSAESGLFVLFLPPDENSQIGLVIKERLGRSIEQQCLADGFPIPRAGQVSASDYEQSKSSLWGPLMAGMLIAVSLLLGMQLMRQRD